MSNKLKLVGIGILTLGALFWAYIYLRGANIAVLSPQGPIGQSERQLIILAVVLSAIVVIPVYIMLVVFAWKFRESNKKARYDPHFDHSRLIESVWWGIPLIIISVLAVATWKGSHELDPFKPLSSSAKPIPIQVVALQWKWLFIYPEQNIATVNYVQFPQKVPVNFEVTADAPMNSFWIPQLGGQIYAMSGMSTKLHLMADQAGTYNGMSANISGSGFSGMNFTAKSTSQEDFNQWVRLVRQSGYRLDENEYQKLAKPSKNLKPFYYSSADLRLYNHIVMKFIDPTHSISDTENNLEHGSH